MHFNNQSINVRTQGQGSGPEFQASVDRLHGLNKKPVYILRLVMEDDDPTGISLDEVVPVLDQLYQPVNQLLIEGMHLEQLRRISQIIACTEMIKLSRIQGGDMLAVPAADSQSLNIEGAQHIDEIRVAAQTKLLSVSNAPNLQAVTAADGVSALLELYLDNCPQHQLTTQPFQQLVTLEISNCVLQHGVDMHALRAVRKTLGLLASQHHRTTRPRRCRTTRATLRTSPERTSPERTASELAFFLCTHATETNERQDRTLDHERWCPGVEQQQLGVSRGSWPHLAGRLPAC